MTHRLATSERIISSLPLPVKQPTPQLDLYSLFERKGDCWQRVRTTAYPVKAAYIVFSAFVVCNPNRFSIRKVRIEPLGANLKYRG